MGDLDDKRIPVSEKANEKTEASAPDRTKAGVKKNKKELTTKHVVLILGIVAIIAAAAVIIVHLLRQKTQDAPKSNVVGIVTEENVKEINESIKDKVAKGMFETHMNTTWHFPDGKSASSNAVMGNASSNNYPFWFTIALADGEIVFTSGIIPVGSEIAEIILDKELEAGRYDASVSINMVEEDGTPVESNMGINVTLVIGS